MPIRRRGSIKKQLRAIKQAMAEIESKFAQVAVRVRHAERLASRKSAGGARRTLRITPKRRAQLKLQGAYMGFMRQLGPRHKAQAKALKEKMGFTAAIALARRLAGR